MCGIAGYFSKSENHHLEEPLKKAIHTLSKRGPDLQQATVLSPKVGFAHARLSIIDTSALGNQPMTDSTGRYTIVFNGEIFNFRELRKKFLSEVHFVSSSDTEVLLNLYAKFGKDTLPLLNGFFAFAIFDNIRNEIFLARDRFGIKPLHVYDNGSTVLFSSELKAIMAFPIKKEINFNTLALYLQLNYIPGANSILKNVQKLNPGHYAVIDKEGKLQFSRYYSIPYVPGSKISEKGMDYDSATKKLRHLIEDAVERRLVSDVPIGAFLSGGIDSSIVTACAAKHLKQLNTFSIGYKDEPFFDETYYAHLVAKKFNTNHTTFSVTNDEMLSHIFSILDYIDEPFADSSAIATYFLSNKTAQKVTVALSGDGGDELFAGYNKHRGELQAEKKNFINTLAMIGLPFLKGLPKSRHSKFTNLFRQLQRYSEGITHGRDERYWKWCTLYSQMETLQLLRKGLITETEIEEAKQQFLKRIPQNGDLNDILFADTQMVLPNDMLTKVDLMSMANSLEVRVPLLDYNVVDFAFSLPVSFKITSAKSKKILKESFSKVLPPELFDRPKRGFEVPLLKWMRNGIRPLIEKELLEKEFIEQQNIFNYKNVETIKRKLYSNNPGDSHAITWSLLVFQYWFKKYFQPGA